MLSPKLYYTQKLLILIHCKTCSSVHKNTGRLRETNYSSLGSLEQLDIKKTQPSQKGKYIGENI